MTHYTITNNLQIEAYLHRVRMDILDVLQGSPATVTQIASRMNLHPANLTRHMRKLEQAGLINLSHKRDTGRNLEKYYASIADTFDIAPDIGAKSIHKSALGMLRSDLSAAIARLPESPNGVVAARLVYAKISAKSADQFNQRLAELVTEFQAEECDDGISYHLNLSLYPSDLTASPSQELYLTNNGKT